MMERDALRHPSLYFIAAEHMDESPFFTVAINTRNRADLLGTALQSIFSQQVDASVEVLVVDNDSTDGTAALVQSLCSDHPNLRYVMEKRLGVGAARNRCMREAQGHVVVFVDDDATLMDGYLARLCAVWEMHQPDAAGGPIDIAWLDPEPPDWSPVLARFRGPFDPGGVSRRVTGGGYPEGCNMALCRSSALAAGNFDPDMGTCRPGTWAGEEIDLFTRMDAMGMHIRYEPELRVTHFQRHAGRTASWLYWTAFERGRTQFLIWLRRYDRLRARAVVGSFVRECLGRFPWSTGAARVTALIAAGNAYEAARQYLRGTWQPGSPRYTRPAE